MSKQFTVTNITLSSLTKICAQTGSAKGYITAAQLLTYFDLGNASGLDVGTTAGTVAAGDDSRFHSPVTVSGDGISLTGQQISLNTSIGTNGTDDTGKLLKFGAGGSLQATRDITIAHATGASFVISNSGALTTKRTYITQDRNGTLADLQDITEARAYTDTVAAGKADLVGGLVPTSQIPAIAITEFLGSVADEAAMLTLTGQSGDWCNRSDVSMAYVLTGSPASNAANWQPINYPASPVLSVNGQAGTIVLGAADVGALDLTGGTLAGDVTLTSHSFGASVINFGWDGSSGFYHSLNANGINTPYGIAFNLGTLVLNDSGIQPSLDIQNRQAKTAAGDVVLDWSNNTDPYARQSDIPAPVDISGKANKDAETHTGAHVFSSTTRPTSAGTGTPVSDSLITRADMDTRNASLETYFDYIAADSGNQTATDTLVDTGLELVLPVGFYQIDVFAVGYALVSNNGGYRYRLNASGGTVTGTLQYYAIQAGGQPTPVAGGLNSTQVNSNGAASYMTRIQGVIEIATATTTIKLQHALSFATDGAQRGIRKGGFFKAIRLT